MTKNEFLKLNENIGQLPPDFTTRIEYMESQFLKLGLSKETGYKTVQYFYNELCKAREQRDTIFKGEVFVTDEYFGISNHFSPYFKMNHINFENRKKIYFPIPKPKKNPSLILRQIALMYFYEGKQITRENGDSIAKQYGHNSGEKLFQHFTYYSATPNRIGKPSPFTQTKLKNKIDLFQSVVNLLPESKKQRAIDELIVLNTHYSNEFE
jgi:hypothetical protein